MWVSLPDLLFWEKLRGEFEVRREGPQCRRPRSIKSYAVRWQGYRRHVKGIVRKYFLQRVKRKHLLVWDEWFFGEAV